MTLSDWIRFIRLKYHISIFLIVVGFLFASEITSNNILRLILIMLFFVILYSGIYVLNDCADYEKDMNNKDKLAVSPLLKGKISRKNALMLGILLILIGELLLSFVGYIYGVLGLIFIIINALYTYYLKRIPYIEIFVNAMTHPTRFWLGYSVVAMPFTNKWFLILTIIIYLACVSIGVTRRLMDMFNKLSTKYRTSLKYYSISSLLKTKTFLLIIVFILYLYSDLPLWLILFGSTLQTLDLILVNRSEGYRSFFRKMGS